jgi:hypothetical protein
MKFNAYILSLLFCLFSNQAIAATYVISMSELDFSDFLPITGSCEMDLDGLVTDMPGSQMCHRTMASSTSTIQAQAI